MHRIDNPMAASETKPGQDAEPLPKKTDIPDELSYIVLLEDWEIAPDNLKLLDKKLGGGQFGIVMQGLLTTTKGDSEVVAVKMLKDSAKESDLQDLMTELTILKEVNKVPHPNVIRLIGGCSIGGKLHVITELCTGGSLRHLLINSRVYPSEKNSSNYINLSSTLNHRQLVKIAADISSGMVHLSSQKFVHRDLAARNILIGEDNMAKVSDFGLARDVGGAEEYIRNNQNLLPVKWMALESLLHGRFTIASDV
ncbi:Fibroblast growth factor receptor 1 [Paramuricea clavata]|uniref:Fibroblast growth factor receptor 1 n=2 Tax=Paramuricea clavata TaxID=317549 RepID=A0A6S7J5V2_PARCT|nr:Fibroblast growth factor receptor 1 [Paramuricea clavata]